MSKLKREILWFIVSVTIAAIVAFPTASWLCQRMGVISSEFAVDVSYFQIVAVVVVNIVIIRRVYKMDF